MISDEDMHETCRAAVGSFLCAGLVSRVCTIKGDAGATLYEILSAGEWRSPAFLQECICFYFALCNLKVMVYTVS